MAFFQAFPVLAKGIIKFQDFPGFPGPVQTLNIPKLMLELFEDFYNIKHTDYGFLHISACTGNITCYNLASYKIFIIITGNVLPNVM